jgi:hypothetical protein
MELGEMALIVGVSLANKGKAMKTMAADMSRDKRIEGPPRLSVAR